MKLLDIFGTNSERFSIGLGENKVEFRSIDGVFYFRNFGSGWEKASSETLKDSVKMRTWNSGIILSQGEIFLYNESIWESQSTIESLNFLTDSNNFVKIADLSNFIRLDASSQSNLYLTSESSDTIYIYNDSLQTTDIFLPDSTTLTIGRKFLFINGSNNTVNVYKRTTNQYESIASQESMSLVLTSNDSVIGDWSKISFGGGGGNNSNEITIPLSEYIGSNPLLGNIVYYNVNTLKWEKAYVGDFDLNIIGFISDVTSNIITIKFFGELEFGDPLTYNSQEIVPGTVYYLTDASSDPGKATSIPTLKNPKKIFIAITTKKILILDLGQSDQKNNNEILIILNLPDYSGTNPFSVGDVVYYNQSTSKWEKAYSSSTDIGSVGFVIFKDDNSIKICFQGTVELKNPLSITPGQYYYLTDVLESAGTYSTSENVKNEKKLFLAISTKIIILLNEPNQNRFNDVKFYTVNNGNSITLNNNQSLLIYKINGYVYNDNNYISFFGIINNASNINTVNAEIRSDSRFVCDYDAPNSLCFIDDGSGLKLKNNLGSTKTIVIFREKFKL